MKVAICPVEVLRQESPQWMASTRG